MHRLSLFLVAILGAPAPTRVQPRSAAQRALDSLIAGFQSIDTVTHLVEIRCDNTDRRVAQLCRGLLSLRRAELTDSLPDAEQADRTVQRILLDQSRSAVAWYTLGMVRLQLAKLHALARPGPLQPQGVTNESGAGYALVEALTHDATLRPAAEALALGALPPPREGASRLQERIHMLRRVRDILSPQALYGAGHVELEGGDPDSAIADFRLALAHGSLDSGIIALGLARAEYQAHRPQAGRAALIAGARDTSAMARALYRQQLAWVADSADLVRWDSTGAGDRPGWLADFWSKRDVADGQPDGSRLVEHYRRYEYALHNYRLMVPESGRPATSQNLDELASEMHEDSLAHAGSTARVDEQFAEDQLALLQVFDLNDHLYGVDNPFAYLPMAQDQLDDRGIVYMRHGKPDQIATGSSKQTAMEVWVYHLPTGTLTLQFMSQDFSNAVGATRLVPTLITGDATEREKVCVLEVSLCPLAAGGPRNRPASFSTAVEVGTGQLTSARIAGAYREGMEEIRQAVTTDENAHRFAAAMHPALDIYAIPETPGGSTLLIPFALSGNDLDSMPHAGTTPLYYSVHFQATAERTGTGEHFALDTTRNFIAREPITGGAWLTGYVAMPLPAGVYHVALTITEPSGRGAVATLDSVRMPEPAGMIMSDLVLGRANSGTHWNSGTTEVALNPLGSYHRNENAELYYQLGGLVSGADYETTVQVFRANDDPKHAPRLTVTFHDTAGGADAEVSRTLGLSQLDPGAYRIVVAVNGDGHSVRRTGRFTITK